MIRHCEVETHGTVARFRNREDAMPSAVIIDTTRTRSQDLAVEAQNNGFFKGEIMPVVLPDGPSAVVDDGPRPNTNLQRLAFLEPVFTPGGTVGNGDAH